MRQGAGEKAAPYVGRLMAVYDTTHTPYPVPYADLQSLLATFQSEHAELMDMELKLKRGAETPPVPAGAQEPGDGGGPQGRAAGKRG